MSTPEEELKRCSGRCRELLPIGEFSWFTEHGKRRQRGQCRACRREKRRETRLLRRDDLTASILERMIEANTDREMRLLGNELLAALLGIPNAAQNIERFYMAQWYLSNYRATKALRAISKFMCWVTKIHDRPPGPQAPVGHRTPAATSLPIGG